MRLRDHTLASDRAADAVAVLAVDDQPRFQSALRQLVEATPGFTLVGQPSSGEEAIAAAEALSPDLVLMDVNMPGIGGVAAARTLARLHPELVVWLVSVESSSTLSRLADACGAHGYVRKEELRPRVLRAMWADCRQ